MMIKDRLNQLTDLELEQLLQQLHEVRSTSSPETHTPASERKTLVAYYLTDTPTSTDIGMNSCEVISGIEIDELRRHCEEQLPAHMRPSRYIPVNCFPTLPNGKIAYKELTKLQKNIVTKNASMSQGKTDKVEADKLETNNTHTETLAKLTEVLGQIMLMDDVRADDNFFEIGGDSITAIQFVSKMREAGYKLDLIAVSESQTIADIVPKCVQIETEPTDAENSLRKEKTQFDSSGLSEEELDSFLSSFD